MMNILLIDDDKEDLVILTELLESDSKVVVNGFGPENGILKQIKEINPDLVMIDIVMPRSGFELAKNLKESGYDGNIVMMSGASSKAEDIEKSLKSGAIFLVTKPNSAISEKYFQDQVHLLASLNRDKN